MGQILIFSENDSVGYELLGQALSIAGSGCPLGAAGVAAAVLGRDTANRADEYLGRGAQHVYRPGVGAEALTEFEAGSYASALAQIAGQAEASVILTGCTRRGKELAGRLAQKLGAGCINDVRKLEVIDGRLVCSRYALGGTTVITQTVATATAVISIMPRTFEPAITTTRSGAVIDVDLDLKPSRLRVVERRSKATDSADISEAKVLVCVGQGLNDQADLAMVEELARLLGGEVACSKPVSTDKHWLAEERIVGLSGKQCKPELAICLGISGQVQFTVGIREARTIVSVNNDPKAYLFQMSDYGIARDLYEVVPKLIQALK